MSRNQDVCPRHDQPRPCRDCAARGWGGARGGGRPRELADPVRVAVSLEREELAAILERFPESSKSAALRSAALGALSPPDGPSQLEARGVSRNNRVERLCQDLRNLGPSVSGRLADVLLDAIELTSPEELGAWIAGEMIARRLGSLSDLDRALYRLHYLEKPAGDLESAIDALPRFSLSRRPPRSLLEGPSQECRLSRAEAWRLGYPIAFALSKYRDRAHLERRSRRVVEGLEPLDFDRLMPGVKSLRKRTAVELGAEPRYWLYAAARFYFAHAEERFESRWLREYGESAKRDDEAARALYRRALFEAGEWDLLAALRRIPPPGT